MLLLVDQGTAKCADVHIHSFLREHLFVRSCISECNRQWVFENVGHCERVSRTKFCQFAFSVVVMRSRSTDTQHAFKAGTFLQLRNRNGIKSKIVFSNT